MVLEAIAIGGLGVVAALGLGVAARVFYVESDPVAEAIEEALPGANCGGCGFAGCSGAAEAIAAGNAAPSVCVAGGAEVNALVSAIMGVEVKETEPQIAQVGCRYPVKRADVKYSYEGLEDCRAAVLMAGGPKHCPVGCIGLGSCVKACPFDALSIGPEDLPVVDPYKCTGCGNCVRTCPVNIMQLTSVTDRILGEYTTDHCTAPCQRTCPAGINIPEQIRLTALGDYAGALGVIKERNPLPLICGRICPHPCELACRRNLSDEPVGINPLKRFVSDWERENGKRLSLYKAPPSGKKIAIIGGGAEGLSAGWFLSRLGHEPVIFESQPKLGGILRTVIPASRLPRDVLDWEIDGILEMGVKAHTGKSLGKDFSLSSLWAEGHDAALLATGGWDSLLLRQDGPSPAPAMPNLFLMLPLALAMAGGQAPEIKGKVAIVGRKGGGEPLLGLAGRLKKNGAESVTVLMLGGPGEFGAPEAELKKAETQGVEFIHQARVTSLRGVGDDFTSLTYLKNGETSELAVDTVVSVSGRLPEMIFIREEAEEGQPVPWRTIAPYTEPREIPDGLFQSLEPASDFAATVEAIGAARRASASMHLSLNKSAPLAPLNMLAKETEVLNVHSVNHLMQVEPRQKMPVISGTEQQNPAAEIETGLDEAQAKAEAKRCLNCGLICYYRSEYN